MDHSAWSNEKLEFIQHSIHNCLGELLSRSSHRHWK